MRRTFVLNAYVSGYFESVIEADSEKEAVKMFEEELINHDFGKLRDVQWDGIDVEDEHPDYDWGEEIQEDEETRGLDDYGPEDYDGIGL